MIQTPYILWAVLATGGAVAVYILMRREVAKAQRARDIWEQDADSARDYEMQAISKMAMWQGIATDLQDKIDRDAAKRSSITSRGNITRAAKRRAKVLEQASRLVEPKALDIAA